MAISNNSTGLRPGVCTSTTRPTAPYEGQHIYETDTDIEYVWNGSAWVVNYVSAASPAFTGTPTAPTATAGTDTTQLATTAFANAAGGLVKITSGSLSGAATNFVGCFTSTYRNYRVVMENVSNSGGTTDVYLRYLSGTTTPYTTSAYYYGFRAITSAGTILDTSGAGINAGFLNLRFNGTPQFGNISMDIFSPQQALRTQLSANSQNLVASAYSFSTGGMSVDDTAVFTGFQINTLGAPTLTGNVTIYGYRNS